MVWPDCPARKGSVDLVRDYGGGCGRGDDGLYDDFDGEADDDHDDDDDGDDADGSEDGQGMG